MEEIKTYKLEDISVGKGCYGIAASAIPYSHNKRTYLRITDINDDGSINLSGLMSVEDENADKFLLNPNDIVFARTGNSTGRSYFYDGSVGPLVYAGFLIKFSLDKTKVNPRILKYYTHSQKYYDWVHSFDTGGTRGNINAKTYGEMPIDLPPIETQNRIVSILKSLDDKIELNKRINDNLELQAQALYKSWFVDFEPFKDGKFVDSELGMIPEGWSIGDIGTYSKVRSGFAFKSSWWTQSGSKVIKIKNITSDYRLDMTECSFVSKDNTAKASEFRVEVGDLLIAMTGATIGKFCLITSSDNNTYVNQRVGKFFLGNEPLKRLPFLYCCLKQDSVINEIINKGQGSAQPNISGTDIESIKIVLPNDETIPIFNEHLYPMYKMIIKNQEEIELLSTMRDSILPKLMSGELKVNDLNN